MQVTRRLNLYTKDLTTRNYKNKIIFDKNEEKILQT